MNKLYSSFDHEKNHNSDCSFVHTDISSNERSFLALSTYVNTEQRRRRSINKRIDALKRYKALMTSAIFKTKLEEMIMKNMFTVYGVWIPYVVC